MRRYIFVLKRKALQINSKKCSVGSDDTTTYIHLFYL